MNLYNSSAQKCQAIYEIARKIYLETGDPVVRHVMENVLVRLLRKGVKPCGKNGN